MPDRGSISKIFLLPYQQQGSGLMISSTRFTGSNRLKRRSSIFGMVDRSGRLYYPCRLPRTTVLPYTMCSLGKLRRLSSEMAKGTTYKLHGKTHLALCASHPGAADKSRD